MEIFISEKIYSIENILNSIISFYKFKNKTKVEMVDSNMATHFFLVDVSVDLFELLIESKDSKALLSCHWKEMGLGFCRSKTGR